MIFISSFIENSNLMSFSTVFDTNLSNLSKIGDGGIRFLLNINKIHFMHSGEACIVYTTVMLMKFSILLKQNLDYSKLVT